MFAKAALLQAPINFNHVFYILKLSTPGAQFLSPLVLNFRHPRCHPRCSISVTPSTVTPGTQFARRRHRKKVNLFCRRLVLGARACVCVAAKGTSTFYYGSTRRRTAGASQRHRRTTVSLPAPMRAASASAAPRPHPHPRDRQPGACGRLFVI